MGLFTSSKKNTKLNWINVTTTDELLHYLNSEETHPVIFFKHSTRCSISSMALNRLENDWQETSSCTLVFIDLIAYREISNLLSEVTGVQHQSPQVIVWKNGKVVHHASHSDIRFSSLKDYI